MSFEFLIDSHAWIEYYLGDNISLKLIIETKKIAVPIIVLAELSDKFTRENEDFNILLKFINSRAKIIPMNAEIAVESGKFKNTMRKKHKQFGIADAVIYITSKYYGMNLVSGDPHFKGLDNVEFIS